MKGKSRNPKNVKPVEFYQKPMTIENHGVKIMQTLRYIESALINGTHKEQSGILQLIISEAIADAKQFSMTFRAPYGLETRKAHFLVFVKRIQKAEATLISRLEELHSEFVAKRVNEKRALVIVRKIIDRNLYKNDVNELMDKWHNSTSKEAQTQLIYAYKEKK